MARITPCCPKLSARAPAAQCRMLEQQEREARAKERAARQQAERSVEDVEEEELQKVGCTPCLAVTEPFVAAAKVCIHALQRAGGILAVM